MNLYWNVESFKAALNVSGSAQDAHILMLLEASSRAVDDYCGRHFYTCEDTRYFEGRRDAADALVDDVLSVSSVSADALEDASWSEAWTPGADFWLWPANGWPKLRVALEKGSPRCMRATSRYLSVTGVFGYGDGRGAFPWDATGATGTVADATGTTLTLSADALRTGETIRIGDEQLYVTAVATGEATVRRGVNGTTASAHAAGAVFRAAYPAMVVQAVQVVTCEAFNLSAKRGVAELQIGDYRERYVQGAVSKEHWARMLGRYCRHEWRSPVV